MDDYEKAIECYNRSLKVNPIHSKAINDRKILIELKNKMNLCFIC
jgi:hypothetical protein